MNKVVQIEQIPILTNELRDPICVVMMMPVWTVRVAEGIGIEVGCNVI